MVVCVVGWVLCFGLYCVCDVCVVRVCGGGLEVGGLCLFWGNGEARCGGDSVGLDCDGRGSR